jgi:SAM-dependent methyltransferase
MKRCNICDGKSFIPGPQNRLAGKAPPACAKCGSLERHRIGRRIILAISKRDEFANYAALQFSDDRLVEQAWFKRYEISIFNGPNSLDVQNINCASEMYDFVICCHVIEHVHDHRKAIVELARVLTKQGLLFLAYPNPCHRAATVDWGFPDWRRFGHYREIGRDFESEYRSIVPNTFVAAVTALDCVTESWDRVYIISKNASWMERLFHSSLQVEMVAGL